MSGKRVRLGGNLVRPVVPDGAVDVTRRSRWGNPHVVGRPCRVPGCGGAEHSRGGAIVAYRRHLQSHPELVEQARTELADKNLACWCWPTEACHGDILLRVVAGEEP